jgi:hypothetical protein
VRGNPSVRLVVGRFGVGLTQLPFQPTLEWAHRTAADFQQTADYFRTRNVQVVNTSWTYDPQEFEEWLSNIGRRPTLEPFESKVRFVIRE